MWKKRIQSFSLSAQEGWPWEDWRIVVKLFGIRVCIFHMPPAQLWTVQLNLNENGWSCSDSERCDKGQFILGWTNREAIVKGQQKQISLFLPADFVQLNDCPQEREIENKAELLGWKEDNCKCPVQGRWKEAGEGVTVHNWLEFQ